MTGSGNDFIVIDNRGYRFDRAQGSNLARLACRRRLSAGADGLILINEAPEVDFQWNFINSDGSAPGAPRVSPDSTASHPGIACPFAPWPA